MKDFLIRLGLKLLRTFLPILKFRGYVVVTRFDDVEEVFSRPNVFGVTYAEKMAVVTAGGNFFLGMNDTETYERDVSNMRVLMPRSDAAAIIKPLVENYANSLVDSLGDNFDFVADLSSRVPVHFCSDYLGVPGPSEKEMITWNSFLFGYLFFPNNPAEFDEKAKVLATDARNYLDQSIATRKQQAFKDDVLGRALNLQNANVPGMSDLDIRNNLIGMTIGAIPTTSMASALIMDYLLDHPKHLALAQQLARADDDDRLANLVLETLRFMPFSPGIFREVLTDYTLGTGWLCSRRLKKGSKVIALTQSAMLDGRYVSRPGHFSVDRPRHIYMPFGYGMHRCFGYYINLVQIPAILKPVLKKATIARAPGKAGKLQYKDLFPAHLQLITTS